MIECGYAGVNYVKLSLPPHHRRPRSGPVLVQVDGYPQKAKTNQRRRPPGGMSVAKLGEEWTPCVGVELFWLHLASPPAGMKSESGSYSVRQKHQLGIWRGLDKAVVRAMENNYIGQTLRQLRAQKGCGRPFISNIWRKDDGIRSESTPEAAVASPVVKRARSR